MARVVVFVLILLSGTLVDCLAAEHIFRLGDDSTPESVRREKARLLVRAWSFVGGEVSFHFVLNDHADLKRVQTALENVLDKQEQRVDDTPDKSLPWTAEHYLVWAVARAKMINSLDFSDPALRHFFKINSARYPCEDTAVVSELVVPATYTDTLGSTRVLEDVRQKLAEDNFGKVTYEISDKFGTPDAGLKGPVTRQKVGDVRFSLYEKAYSGGGIGGPYEVPEGYLFVQIHNLSGATDGCFGFYRDKVVADYGREWLKKIYSDTIATASLELNPDISEYTTATDVSDVAFSVAGHTVTFAEARELLPFLQGNPNDPRFWKSIQRQALEVELIYHSKLGQNIRGTASFQNLKVAMADIQESHNRIDTLVENEATTSNVSKWYESQCGRFAEISHVSYSIYTCGSSGSISQGNAKCAALLELLSQAIDDTRLSSTLVRSDVTSEPWNSLPRATQAAIQDLSPSQWTKVFSISGEPQRLKVYELAWETQELKEIYSRVKAEYKMVRKTGLWERYFGIKFD